MNLSKTDAYHMRKFEVKQRFFSARKAECELNELDAGYCLDAPEWIPIDGAWCSDILNTVYTEMRLRCWLY